MDFVVALSPLVVVLAGLLCFKKPAMKVAPVALLYTIVLSFTYFNVNGLSFNELVAATDPLLWKGIKEAVKIVCMLIGSFVTLNIMQRTGAMEVVKHTLANLTEDRRAQLVIVGMMVPIFLEGAAGAGAPAAIAAPFLLGMGFDPITAVAAALLGDATPVSWGGAGLTTITGGASLVDAGLATTAMNSAMVGRIHMFGVLIIPFILVGMAFGRKGFKGCVPYLFYAGATTCLTMFALSNFVGPEITSMGTGVISILLSVLYLKLTKTEAPAEYRYKSEQKETTGKHYSVLQAFSPYLLMLVLLPVVRYSFPMSFLTKFGYIVWVDVVIFLCAVLGSLILGVRYSEFASAMSETVKKVVPVLVTMGSLLVLAYIMQSANTGMMNLIAQTIAGLSAIYPAAAVLIGSAGAFVTGTGLGSNIMFAPLHTNTSAMLSLNPVTVFAGQNAGASLGNLICPNNTVAACATVNQLGRESEVMKKTLMAWGILLVEYMVLSMTYTYFLFPNFHL